MRARPHFDFPGSAADVSRRALRMRARIGESLPYHVADKCVRFVDAAERLDKLDTVSVINRRLAAIREGRNPDAEPVFDELHPKAPNWTARP